MALIQATIMSQSLMRTVPVNVIIPADKLRFPGMPERGEKPYKTLYLLHGVFGSCIDWVSGTNIQRWAEEKDLAVVMPSGDNRFYVDQPVGDGKYGEFIGKELVEVTRKLFPLSRKKEDTYIAGLSMGGYGALRNGLKYHETFGCVAGLSSALLIDQMNERVEEPFFLNSRSYAERCFGDLSKVVGSDVDPKWLAKQLVEKKADIPRIYMACGVDDGLLGANQDLKNYLESLGIPVTYEEGAGAHEWDFWNRYIKRVLDWLPLENNGAGINSGNVGV